MSSPERNETLTSATEGLPVDELRKQVTAWQSKAIVHKKLQTVRLVYDTDVRHITPNWDHIYEIVDVVVKRV